MSNIAAAALDPDPVPDSPARTRTKKAPNAFRTISEVADDLHIPQHVLRFWETKFPQIRPLKRGGGRRYYRPDDIQLLRRIADLLYTQGYTIKGVQRLLREGGGKLGDNIPPASETEHLPEPAEPEPVGEPLLPFADVPEPTPVLAVASEPDPPGRDDVLRDILAELEDLRALLG